MSNIYIYIGIYHCIFFLLKVFKHYMMCHINNCISINVTSNIYFVIVEHIKSTPDVRDRILSASRAARLDPNYPIELQPDYFTAPAIVCEKYQHLQNFTLHQDHHVLANGGRANGSGVKVLRKYSNYKN